MSENCICSRVEIFGQLTVTDAPVFSCHLISGKRLYQEDAANEVAGILMLGNSSSSCYGKDDTKLAEYGCIIDTKYSIPSLAMNGSSAIPYVAKMKKRAWDFED